MHAALADAPQQPSVDWIGAVLVPIAAILVSSGIAIWIAHVERKSADAARAREFGAIVSRSLTNLAREIRDGNVEQMNRARATVSAELNALAIILPKRDHAIPKFIAVVLHRALTSGVRVTRDQAIGACTFLTTCIEGWASGSLTARDFEREMPEDVGPGEWSSTADLSLWRKHLPDS